MGKIYEIRDTIHGFITLDEWEWDIVNHPVFQRLRRIRQLGLTDMVYPGAAHTRFEHSLGVMHVATKMFDEIVKRCSDFLKSELSFTEGGLERDRVLIRLSCLLHDVGHAPFSHTAEGLMAKKPSKDLAFKHEDYSAAVVTFLMQDVIENHKLNQNYGITAKDIAEFLNEPHKIGRNLLWRDLVSGQLDADRADYLLRDSHHIGVAYGHYDLNRLLVTLTVAVDQETNSPTIAVEEGGLHAAEAIILARYMMFTQVYFQHTRRAYDHHSLEVMKILLREVQDDIGPSNQMTFPPPDSKEDIEEYLKWDDWRVLGLVSQRQGGTHGDILLNRNHHRCVFQTSETPDETDVQLADNLRDELAEHVSFVDNAANSWYKFESADIPVLLRPRQGDEELTYLSCRSSVVNGLKAVNQIRIYVPPEKKAESRNIVERYTKKRRKHHE